MINFRIFKTASRGLTRNVMRAILTTLGIVIGIAAVITMMEIGQGSSAAIQKSIASMGANNLMIMPGQATSGGVSFGAGTTMTLTPGDVDSIAADCPSVRAAAPLVRSRVQLVYGNKNWVPQQIYGTSPDYLNVRDWTDMAEGDAFTDRDVRNASKVCLLGQTEVKQLFGDQSAIGKEVRLQNVAFKVVGVLSAKGANMMGMDQDDIVLAPWTTIKYRVSNSSLTNTNQSAAASSSSSSISTAVNTLSNLYPETSGSLYDTLSDVQQADTPLPIRFTNVDTIMAAAGSTDEIPDAISEITQLLRQRHRTKDGAPEDFQIRDMTEISKVFSSTSDRMTSLLLYVALISLVVGGVGIMNIMLVSVTERTKEIGLRMAVGARAFDILEQFLIEAVLLCLIGGIVGIMLGELSSWIVRHTTAMPTQTSVWAMVISVIVSGVVGFVFGMYPAWKASRLDPIDALRYE